ncbi:MAG: insulinase family protein [Deltaproteobacteria bacterium]|nr:insulinase family protein [Deltaproteobacteria bacterium]
MSARAALLALALVAHAAPARAGTSRGDAPGAPVVERLLDGTTMLFLARPGAARAAVRVVVRAGADDDPPGRAGLAELTAHAVLQGTYDMRPGALFRLVENAGGTFGLEVAPDATVLAIDVGTAGVRDALGALLKTVTAPALPFIDLERARFIVGTVDVEAAPLRRAGWAARHVAFPSGHGGLVSSGSGETRRAVTRDDVATFFQEHWVPWRTTVIVVGDLERDEVRRLVEQGLHGAPVPDAPRARDQRSPNVPSEAHGKGRRTMAVSAAVLEPAPDAACATAAALLELRLRRELAREDLVETHAGCERAFGAQLLSVAVRSTSASASTLPELVRAVRRSGRTRPVSVAERAQVAKRVAARHAGALVEVPATAALLADAARADEPLDEAGAARALKPLRLDWAGAARVLAMAGADQRAVEVAFSPFTQ